jgi:hypothetical protein
MRLRHRLCGHSQKISPEGNHYSHGKLLCTQGIIIYTGNICLPVIFDNGPLSPRWHFKLGPVCPKKNIKKSYKSLSWYIYYVKSLCRECFWGYFFHCVFCVYYVQVIFRDCSWKLFWTCIFWTYNCRKCFWKLFITMYFVFIMCKSLESAFEEWFFTM